MTSSSFHDLTKPIGPICNLDCKYSFYPEKEPLCPTVAQWAMRDDLLSSYIKQYIEAQQGPSVSFAWQGGEPTLLGVNYFRRVVALQREYAHGKRIADAFQTNGVLLNDTWAAFFKEHGFLVEVSMDGPRACQWKLFDLTIDPYEMENLFEWSGFRVHPDYETGLPGLVKQLSDLRKTYKDTSGSPMRLWPTRSYD